MKYDLHNYSECECCKCRIDENFVIKVADFGLSEDIYSRNYFRQDEDGEAPVKLPVRWMALESLSDGIFSEMTDVVIFPLKLLGAEVVNCICDKHRKEHRKQHAVPGIEPLTLSLLVLTTQPSTREKP